MHKSGKYKALQREMKEKRKWIWYEWIEGFYIVTLQI